MTTGTHSEEIQQHHIITMSLAKHKIVYSFIKVLNHGNLGFAIYSYNYTLNESYAIIMRDGAHRKPITKDVKIAEMCF